MSSLDGEILALDGVGRFTYDPESPAVTPMTVFDLASVTKVMATTAAAMLLYDRRRLDLDLLVGDLLPGFAIGAQVRSVWHRERCHITLRHLLAHSSGLPAYARLFETNRTAYALLEACLSTPLEASPGTRAEYSDIGFILLGKALEVLAREPLDIFCAREIFAPLALTATRYQPPPAWRTRIPPTVDDQPIAGASFRAKSTTRTASSSAESAAMPDSFPTLSTCSFSPLVFFPLERPPDGQQLFQPSTINSLRLVKIRPPIARVPWDGTLPPANRHRGVILASARSDISATPALLFGSTSNDSWPSSLLTNRTWPDRSTQAIRTVRPLFHDAVFESLTLL